MILDSHSHYLPDEIRRNASFYPPVWSDEKALLEFMDRNNIKRSVLLYPTTDAYKKMGSKDESSIYNRLMSDLINKYPKRFLPAFILPQESKEEMLKEAEFAVNNLGLSALSIPSSFKGRYLDDEFYFPVYELLEKKNVVIFVHSQTEGSIGTERFFDPLLTPVMQYLFDLSACLGKLITSKTFAKFPRLKFVFAHFGGVIPILARRFDTTYSMLRGINVVKDLGEMPTDILRKVYVDTSGVSSLNVLNCAIEVFGVDKILWGSDYPANKEAVQSLEMIKQLKMGSEDILGKNLEKLL